MSLPIASQPKRTSSSIPMNIRKMLTIAATNAHALNKDVSGETSTLVSAKRDIKVKVESKLRGGGGKKRKSKAAEAEPVDGDDDDFGNEGNRGANVNSGVIGGGTPEGGANNRVLRGDVKRKTVVPVSDVPATSVQPSSKKRIRVKVERVEEDKSSDSLPLDTSSSSSSSDSSSVTLPMSSMQISSLTTSSSSSSSSMSTSSALITNDTACPTLERPGDIPPTHVAAPLGRVILPLPINLLPPPAQSPRVKREGGRRSSSDSKRKASTHGIKKARTNRTNFINKLCEHVDQRQELYSSSFLFLLSSSSSFHTHTHTHTRACRLVDRGLYYKL
jgi:hypothetical protein